jgi:hypothetical protein
MASEFPAEQAKISSASIGRQAAAPRRYDSGCSWCATSWKLTGTAEVESEPAAEAARLVFPVAT